MVAIYSALYCRPSTEVVAFEFGFVAPVSGAARYRPDSLSDCSATVSTRATSQEVLDIITEHHDRRMIGRFPLVCGKCGNSVDG